MKKKKTFKIPDEPPGQSKPTSRSHLCYQTIKKLWALVQFDKHLHGSEAMAVHLQLYDIDRREIRLNLFNHTGEIGLERIRVRAFSRASAKPLRQKGSGNEERTAANKHTDLSFLLSMCE